MNKKLHSARPWFFLTALLALAPVLHNKYPNSFFPAIPSGVVDLMAVFGGAWVAAVGFARAWALAQRRSRAKTLLESVAKDMTADEKAGENDLGQSGRLITRLVRNTEVDLAEMKPDLSLGSLSRLKAVVPALLDEIGNEEDARIRLGILGVYIGETLCRTKGWQWDFKARPSLRQFTYQASRLVKDGTTLDVFQKASELMTGRLSWGAFLKEVGR